MPNLCLLTHPHLLGVQQGWQRLVGLSRSRLRWPGAGRAAARRSRLLLPAWLAPACPLTAEVATTAACKAYSSVPAMTAHGACSSASMVVRGRWWWSLLLMATPAKGSFDLRAYLQDSFDSL